VTEGKMTNYPVGGG